MSDAPGAPRLNRYQRTAVAAALRHLEVALDTIDTLLLGAPDGLLTVTTSDLTDDERRRLGELTGSVRTVLAEVVAAWGLEPTVRDGRRVMAAQLALAWEGLEDARPARLGRTGRWPPGCTRRWSRPWPI
jgi:hypothetical protein